MHATAELHGEAHGFVEGEVSDTRDGAIANLRERCRERFNLDTTDAPIHTA